MVWLLSIAAAAQAAAGGVPAPAIELPPGFVLEKAAVLADSLLSISFDERGRPYVGVEARPSQQLVDADGDGLCETSVPFAPTLTSVQCLLWRGATCFATGVVDGRAGIYRIELDEGGAASSVRCLLPVGNCNEHTLHQLAFGPGGELFAMCGDQTRVSKPPRANSPLQHGLDGNVLPILPDPSGHGNESRWPYGFVARVDPDTGDWSYHSVGYRNAYDLAFDGDGELFTCDSDMEWDVGLPWYRPVRVLHSVFLGDYGSRRGSCALLEPFPDTLPEVAVIGRGSPTGVAFATGSNWPSPWRDAFLVADWALAKIEAVNLHRDGASYSGKVETFASGAALGSITDHAFSPRGDLWFVRGGRATVGDVQRIVWRGEPARPASTRVPDAPANSESLSSAKERAWLATPDKRLARLELGFLALDEVRVRDHIEAIYARMGDSDRWVRWAARQALARLDDADLAPLVPRLETEKDGRCVLELVQLLAPRAQLVESKARLEAPILRALAPVRDGNQAVEPAAPLRLLQIVRAIRGVSRTDSGPADPVPFSMELLPEAPAAARRLALELMSQAQCCGEVLLHQLETTVDRVEVIHVARCASASRVNWSGDDAIRFFRWFESTAEWKGSVNYRGYLDAIRAEFLASLPAETALDAVRRGRFSPAMLAWFVRMLPPARAAELVPALGAAYAALPIDGPGLAERRVVLEAVSGTRSPEARDWLRVIAGGPGLERGVALRILAKDAQPRDLELLLDGLSLDDFGTPGAAADAIVGLAGKCDDAVMWSRALDAAHYLQHPTGWGALRVVAHWAATDPPSMRPEEWASELTRMEAAYSGRFPDRQRTPQSFETAPNWPPPDRLAAIVTNAGPRGSPARGRGVFERATCDRCHVMGTAYQKATIQRGTAGPDLFGVSKRFNDAQIIETILFPSRVISDQYRSIVISTRDELRVEGRVFAETQKTIDVLLADGTTATVPKDDIETRAESKVSQMPEGLLARLPIGDVVDLLAYLRADGRVERVDQEWKPLFDGLLPEEWIGDRDVWKLDHGTLVGRGAKLARSSYLVSKAVYTDFEAEFDVRISRNGNSGLQYRSRVDPSQEDPIGYQADIGQAYWGALYESAGRGVLHEGDPFTWRRVVDPLGWNHYRVLVEGDRHVIEVNGVVLTDVHDAVFASGCLGFQVHQGIEMEVCFANVRFRSWP